MSIEAMKQAQAAIKSALDFYAAMFGVPVDGMLVTHHSEAKALFEKCTAAMESLGTAIEQAAQRPIKTFHGGTAWPVQEPSHSLGPGQMELSLRREHNGELFECRRRFSAEEVMHGPDWLVEATADNLEVEMGRAIQARSNT